MDLEKETYKEEENNTAADSNSEGSRTTETLLKGKRFKIAVVVLCVVNAILFLIALCGLTVILVKIEDLQNNSNCTCATLDKIQELEEANQQNISDLNSKVLALQTRDTEQAAQLQSLGSTQTNQGIEIVVIREQIATIVEHFTALGEKVDEQEERVNLSIRDTVQKFVMIQYAIAENTNQISILNATIRDAYGLGTNITRFVMESELLAAQLRSVNTSVQVQGASIQKLRVDTDVIRNEVILNTNELNDIRANLSGRIDKVALQQDKNTALLRQQSANISNITNEVGALKSSGLIAVASLSSITVVLVIFVVAALVCFALKSKK